ncbi:MAG: purine-nucleoside phosphorylase [Clostridiales bacterium]|nr:purine-nucleoside phosphorylase [Clostridiales bacterium]
MTTPTPHNSAKSGEIANTVLMPGDPMRAKYIAENFIENPRLVNNVRGIQGYTGTWKNTEVTVMASGMGIPSIGIYSWELFNSYDVDNIIRIGTAGAISDELELNDVIFALGACTDSNFMNQFKLPGAFAPICDYKLLKAAERAASRLGIEPVVGNILSTDVFHADDPADTDAWRKMGVLAVEMEAAGLYANAARSGKRALAICTVSDHLYRPEKLSPEEREKSLTQMINIALDTAVMIEGETK